MTKVKALKKTSKKKKSIHSKHVHIETIPLKYFPKIRGNKAKLYREELRRMNLSMNYNNRLIQYSSQICSFNIKSINLKKVRRTPPQEIFRTVQDFVYHYENYCFRTFVYREKLLRFINAILPLAFEERDASIKNLMGHPLMKAAKLKTAIEKFKTSTVLGDLIENRNSLTHKLYYGENFDKLLRPNPIKLDHSDPDNKKFKIWCKSWNTEIFKRSLASEKAMQLIISLDGEVGAKIVRYKESLKAKGN